jgi:hypothetical protein
MPEVVELSHVDEQAARGRADGPGLAPDGQAYPDAGGGQRDPQEEARHQIKAEEVAGHKIGPAPAQDHVPDPHPEGPAELGEDLPQLALEADPEQQAEHPDPAQEVEHVKRVGAQERPVAVDRGDHHAEHEIADQCRKTRSGEDPPDDDGHDRYRADQRQHEP